MKRTRRMPTCCAAACSAFLFAIPPRGLRAQGAVATAESSGASWLLGWSPLCPFGELSMPIPRVSSLPQLTELPSPRLGLSWTSGNPAGLPDEIDPAWTRLSLAGGNVSGTYHTPLDADNVKSFGTSLIGWRRLGSRAAAIGRVVVEHESVRGAYGAFATPLASSPFVPADTNRPALARPTVTLEGAEGMTLGSWRLGVSAGYRAAQDNSAHSAAALDGRSTTTGVTAGIARAMTSGWRAGAHGRWLNASESVDLNGNPGDVRIYPLNGYVNVESADYNPLTAPFLRRADRDGSALGLGFAGELLGATVTSFAEGQWMDERQISAVVAEHPPTDHWRTSGLSLGVSAQRYFGTLLARIDGTWRTQRGDGRRAADSTSSFRANANRLWTAGELRYAAGDSSWSGGALFSLERDQQEANDFLAGAATNITAWVPNAAVELSRRLSPSFSISTGVGVAQYTPFATLPQPEGRGAAYDNLIAPAIEIAAATARSAEASLGARFRRRHDTMSIRLWRTTTTPVVNRSPLIPLPAGTSSAWVLSVSFEPGP